MASQKEIDDHRRELLNKAYEEIRFGKPFFNTSKEIIQEILLKRRDEDRFTEEEMLSGLGAFLQRQKGISPNRGTGTYEIRGPLKA